MLIAVGFALTGSGAAAGAKAVWLCKPGLRPDARNPGLSTTVYSPSLRPLRLTYPRAVKHPGMDCFYVYPTVSDETTVNADFRIGPEARSIALLQAARYSQYCRVYAPMYRQHTLHALATSTTLPRITLGLRDVQAAFHRYLAKDNHGRGFVLIGHSQGAGVLEALIAKDIDGHPSLRRRMLSAILIGGNVLVKRRRGVGATFTHIPACRTASKLGCVIAFSTFDQRPPPDSRFGRTPVPGDQILCTNPATLAGGAANNDSVFPSAPFPRGTLLGVAIGALHLRVPRPSTVWVSEPGAYRARCQTASGAIVLAVRPRGRAQVPTPSPDPTWGLHLLGANLELGNLLSVVESEARAFTTVVLVRRRGA